MQTVQCVSHDELKAFSLGLLPEDRSDEILSHLSECFSCEETVTSFDDTADSLVASLRGMSQSPPVPASESGSWDGSRDDGISTGGSVLSKALSNVRQTMVSDPKPSSAGAGRSNLQRIVERIRDYELLEQLGSGGMGTVYRALHTRLERIVALKLLPARRLRDEAAVARFEREMKAIGRLDHPAIVRATDAGDVDGTHYLAMDYVEGIDLSRLVRLVGPLAPADACELIRQAAIGLQHAHEQGLIHRDVKPSNLMLTKRGEVRILDLGLALFGAASEAVDELTTVGQLMGTLDYMAPEQGDDCHDLDQRADVYSLGASLCKLLTGKAPFDAPGRHSPLAKMRALATISVPSISERRENLSPELVAIVDRLLSRDPNERPASAEEVAGLLAPFCEGHSLTDLVECGLHLAEQEPEPDSMASLPSFVRGRNQSSAHSMTGRSTVDSRPPTQIRRRLLRWILAPVILLAGFAIWIKVDSGTIVIDCAEDNVPLEILKNDEHYDDVVLDQGENTLTVRAGNIRLVLPKNYDRLRIDDGTFTLERLGRRIASISKRPQKQGSNVKPQVGATTPQTETRVSTAMQIPVVLVDLPPGTVIKPSHVELVAWPVAKIPSGSVTSQSEVIGRAVKQGLVASQPILEQHLEVRGDAPAVEIPAGMRLTTIDVAGNGVRLIKSGDDVDVHVSVPRASDPQSRLYTVQQRLRVFAVESVRPGTSSVRLDHKVSLLVTPRQHLLLIAAQVAGEFILAVRAPGADGPEDVAQHPPFTLRVLAQRSGAGGDPQPTTGVDGSDRDGGGFVATPVTVSGTDIENEELAAGEMVDVLVIGTFNGRRRERKELSQVRLIEVPPRNEGASPDQDRVVTLLLSGSDADRLEDQLNNESVTGIRLKRASVVSREPVFSGKSFFEWKRIVETERNPEDLEKAVRALCLLGRNHRDEEAARVILGILGNYFSYPGSQTAEGRLVHAAIDGVRQLDPAKVEVPFIEALEDGNEKQLFHVASWFLSDSTGFPGFGRQGVSLKDGTPLMRTLLDSVEIKEALLSAWSKRSDRNRLPLFTAVTRLIKGRDTDKAVTDALRVEAYDEKSVFQLHAARLLAEVAPEPLLAQQFLNFLESAPAPDREWWNREEDAWLGLAYLGSAASGETHRIERLLTRFYTDEKQWGAMRIGIRDENSNLPQQMPVSRRLLALECLTLASQSRGNQMRQVLMDVGRYNDGQLDPAGRFGVEARTPNLALELILQGLAESKLRKSDFPIIVPNIGAGPDVQSEASAFLNSVVVSWERATGSRARFRGKEDSPFGPWSSQPSADVGFLPRVTAFDGRTCDEWIDLLKSEKDPAKLVEGIKAVCLLGASNDQDAKAFEAVLSVFDEKRFPDFGFEGTVQDRGEVTSAALQFLELLKPVDCEKGIMEALRKGRGRQWDFVVGHLLQPDWVMVGDLSWAQRTNVAEMAALSVGIRGAIAESLAGWNELQEPRRKWMLDLVAHGRRWSNEPHFSAFLRSLIRLDSQATDSQRLTAVELLFEQNEETPGCRDLLMNLLEKSDDARTWLRSAMALEHLKNEIAPVVPKLIEILVKECEAKQPPVVVFSTGRTGQETGLENIGRPPGLTFIVSKRICIVDLLGNIGNDPARQHVIQVIASQSGMKSYSGNLNRLGTTLQQLVGLPKSGGRLPKLKPVIAEAETNEFKRSASASLLRLSRPEFGPITSSIRPGRGKPASRAKPGSDIEPMTVYDGRSFDDWLAVCRNERSPEQLEKAVQALGAIGREHRGDEAVAQILDALQRFSVEGINEEEPVGRLLRAARDQLRLLDPETVAEAVISTIRDGNANQRRFLVDYFFRRAGRIGSTSYVGEAKRITNRLNASDEFARVLVSVWSEFDEEVQDDAFQRLNAFHRGEKTLPEITALLKQIVEDESSPLRVLAARQLAGIHPDTDGLAAILFDVIRDPADPERNWWYERGHAYLGLFPLMRQESAPVDDLIEILESRLDDDSWQRTIGLLLRDGKGEFREFAFSERVLLAALLGEAGSQAKHVAVLLEEVVERPVSDRVRDYEQAMSDRVARFPAFVQSASVTDLPTNVSSSIRMGGRNVTVTSIEPLILSLTARSALARITEDKSWLTRPVPYKESQPQGARSGFGGRSRASSGPLYEGVTFGAWERRIRVEKSPERLGEAIKALATLSAGKQDARVMQIILDVVETVSSDRGPVEEVANLHQLASQQAIRLNAADCVPTIVEVIMTGNTAQRRFIFDGLLRLWPAPKGKPEAGLTRMLWKNEEYSYALAEALIDEDAGVRQRALAEILPVITNADFREEAESYLEMLIEDYGPNVRATAYRAFLDPTDEKRQDELLAVIEKEGVSFEDAYAACWGLARCRLNEDRLGRLCRMLVGPSSEKSFNARSVQFSDSKLPGKTLLSMVNRNVLVIDLVSRSIHRSPLVRTTLREVCGLTADDSASRQLSIMQENVKALSAPISGGLLRSEANWLINRPNWPGTMYASVSLLGSRQHAEVAEQILALRILSQHEEQNDQSQDTRGEADGDSQ